MDVDRAVGDGAAPRDQAAVRRQQSDAGRGDRPQRAGGRRDDREPCDGDEEEEQQGGEDPACDAPAAEAGLGGRQWGGRLWGLDGRAQRRPAIGRDIVARVIEGGLEHWTVL